MEARKPEDLIEHSVDTAADAYLLIVQEVGSRLDEVDWVAAGVLDDEKRKSLYAALYGYILEKNGTNLGAIGLAQPVKDRGIDLPDHHAHKIDDEYWFVVERLPLNGLQATYLRDWLWTQSVRAICDILGADKSKVVAMIEQKYGIRWSLAWQFTKTYRELHKVSEN